MRKPSSNTKRLMPGATARFFSASLVVALMAALMPLAKAQTITFSGTPPPVLTPNIYVGANFSGVYTNLQFKSTVSPSLSPANPITYTFTGVPSGATITTVATGTTNTVTTNIVVAVTNVTAGTYAVTMTPFTNGIQFGTAAATFNIVAGNLWTNLSSSLVNWNTAANWTLGVPGTADNVMFQDVGGLNPATNYVSASTTIGSLSYIRSQNTTTNFLTIADGATLAVAGANGFSLNEDTWLVGGGGSKGMAVRIAGFGGARLVVTNPAANYAVNGASAVAISASSGTALLMTNLDNQFVNVSRVGFGDATLMDRGAVFAENIWVDLAKTNVFIANYPGTFGGVDFTNAIQCFNQYNAASSAFSHGSPMTLNLGISNIFLADSMRIAGNAVQGQNEFRFHPIFTNTGVLPVALFRNTNGGRMNFFGIAVSSGDALNTRFSRANVRFNQGIVDMKVDTMWLGANRTNDGSSSGSGNAMTGNLIIGGTLLPTLTSVVDVNQLIAGNQVFTNNVFCSGNITVNTNALLIVNNYLELGHTTGDTNAGNAAKGLGNLTINGGSARVKEIRVGDLSTNNQIVLNIGSRLIVSNTIASPVKGLTTLNVNGAQITFRVTIGSTNACVTNLITGANVTLINIASISGLAPNTPATNILIAYQDAFASHNVALGTLPAGFNNLQVLDDPANKVVNLVVLTNAPHILAWRGGASSDWNHSDLNWLDTNSLAITKFTDGDRVIFDNTAAVPTNINITEVINPGQTGVGIYSSNNLNAFTFVNGGGSIGNCSMVKDGTNSFQIDALTTITLQQTKGTITGSGTIAGTTVSAGAKFNFGGTVSGALQVAGTSIFTGTANNSVTVQSGGVMTNTGIIQGNALTLDSGALLHNAVGGTLLSIGNVNAVNVATNATLVNEGNIGAESQANSLTVNGTFKDLGVGLIYLTTATFNGGSIFLPGGNGIGTTEIKSALTGSGFPGRLTMLANSTTLIKVDFANAQTNTLVVAQFTDFGGNIAVKSFDGCTVALTNVNTGAGVFANGQIFRVFTGPGGGDIGNEGLNTTNRYPIVTPIIPVTNTKWDLSSLRDTIPNGFLNITGFPTTGTNLTFSSYLDSGNLVTRFQWPGTYIGWKLQQQTNSLSVGLYTNWTTIAGSSATNDIYITNSPSIPAAFFRMIYP